MPWREQTSPICSRSLREKYDHKTCIFKGYEMFISLETSLVSIKQIVKMFWLLSCSILIVNPIAFRSLSNLQRACITCRFTTFFLTEPHQFLRMTTNGITYAHPGKTVRARGNSTKTDVWKNKEEA